MPELPEMPYAEVYWDDHALAWRCAECDAVMQADGDCPRCDSDGTVAGSGGAG